MKTLSITLFWIVLFFLHIISPAFSVNYIAVTDTPAINNASITASLSSNSKTIEKNTFLSNEAISLSFQLNIAKEDIGADSELYLFVIYNNLIFMRTQSDQWQAWNKQDPLLVPTIKKKLQTQETIHVINKHHLPVGEYIIVVAYQTASGDIKYNHKAVTFMVSDSTAPTLHRIKSPLFLNELLSKAQDNTSNYIYTETDTAEFSNAATATPTGDNAVSQTNIQEVGVDESDTIKTSANILFALEQCQNKSEKPADSVSDSSVSVSVSTSFAPYPQSGNTCLSSYQLEKSPASARQLDKISLPDSTYNLGSLYLNETDTVNLSEQLIWISDTMTQNIWSSWGMSDYWTDNQVTLQFFDISNPEEIVSTTQISLDGALIASRKIGDQLYLITRKNYYPVTPYTNSTMKNSPLPEISFNQGTKRSLVKPNDCYVPASPGNQAYDGSIVTITTFSVTDPTLYQSICVTGNIETAYVSTEAVYLASSRYPYETLENTIYYDQTIEYSTDIHKFSLTDEYIGYKGSANIPGHLGWEMDKKPFRMGEHNGILKVATSLGSNWGTDSTTRVGVLRENTTNHRLDEISHINNLGKPGEKLYAARFIGDRGYLVTFRMTDPLYLLDFSEPEYPEILGELEINGYSDYLHPIGENYLLGIGKDAIADSSLNNNENRGAWYQGVKLSLFDVSDGSHLHEVQSIVIGQRGTESAVLSDHHALAWLANDDPNQFRLAIPINEHATKNEWQSNYNDPSAYYSWTKTGAYVFDINIGETPGLKQSGTLITESLQNGDQQSYSNNERVVLQGDALHYIHNNNVYSSVIK